MRVGEYTINGKRSHTLLASVFDVKSRFKWIGVVVIGILEETRYIRNINNALER